MGEPWDENNPAATSQVTFEIQPLGPDVKLTVTHSDLEAGSKIQTDIINGWPAVLSNLKTLLETGTPLGGDIWG